MRAKTPRFVVLVAAVGLVASACTTGGGGFTIGILSPFTGDLSDFGPAMAEAVKLAAAQFEEAAKAANLEIEVDTASEDTQTSPDPGREAARKLLEANEVKLFVGPMASGVTIPVAESVAIPEKILLITPSATSGKITDLKDDGLINRTPPSDEFQAPILADLVAQNVPKGSEIALGARNDAYGVFIINGDEPSKLNGVKQELEARGLTTREPVFWNPEATTFDSEAQKLVDGSPAAWVLVDFPSTWQKISAALVRTDKWDPAKTFSADGLKTSKLPKDAPTGSGKEATEGMRGTAPGGVGIEAFNALWDKEVPDIVPETFSPQAYDATNLGLLAALQAAVKKAGSNEAGAVADQWADLESAEISAELRAVSREGQAVSWDNIGQGISAVLAGTDIDYDGVSGPVNLDENGNVESVGANYDVYVYQNGELVVTSVEKATALG